jgi:hypothetical protein
MKYIILILLVFVSSCISTKPANNEKKAKHKLEKYNKGIKNQIKAYPQLISSAYIIKETITISVPGDSLKMTVLLQELEKLKKINNSYNNSSSTLDLKIDSIFYYVSDSVNLNNYKLEIKNLATNVKILNNKNKVLFNEYQKLATQEHIGTYEDSLYLVNYEFKNGILFLDIKNKNKNINVEVDKEVYDIQIKKHFYQDYKFWLIVLIVYFYFFKIHRHLSKLILWK